MSTGQRLWGARFRTPPDPALLRLSRAEPGYFRLVPYDIVSSQAHARELLRAGILSAAERPFVCWQSHRPPVEFPAT